MFWHSVLAISLMKLLFVPYYTSTDFEVHRNWLAISHSLPINKWYTESTSEWTLDYPPFFAWFEWILSKVAQYVDSDMLKIDNLHYKSDKTVLFQRISVIISDIILAIGIRACANSLNWEKTENLSSHKKSRNLWNKDDSSEDINRSILSVLILANAGLVMVDHIHFQYNGILFGILLLSIARMITENFVQSAAYFVILLNMKHIFMYSAPVYFVYLFRSYCCPILKVNSMTNLFKLAFTVILGFALSFGPFVINGQLMTVMERLFPVKRGLTHAYWAPNFWAIYSFLDRLLAAIMKKFNPDFQFSGGSTSGLVQETVFAILPDVSIMVTIMVTLLVWAPVLIKLWNHPNEPDKFLQAMTLCTFISFLFGYHVHEKAILMVTIPWTILFVANYEYERRMFVFLTTIANFSLFPLLFRDEETLVKVALHCFYITCSVYCQNIVESNCYKSKPRVFTTNRKGKTAQHSNTAKEVKVCNLPLVRTLENVYLAGSIAIFIFPYLMEFLMDKTQLKKYTFLPLLNYSIYCALGNMYLFSKYYVEYILSD